MSPNSTSATEDLADVERVLASEPTAFAGIVRRWQTPLINMAWRYCRDRGRAEELAQEAFLRAWRGLAQWRRESSFSTWLFALAANVFRSELSAFPRPTCLLNPYPSPPGPHRSTMHWPKSRARKRCGARSWPCPFAIASR